MSKQGMGDPWKHRFCSWTDEETARSWDRDAGWREPEPSPRVLYDFDWLDHSPEALADLLALIAETPHLTWCLFSERPGEWAGKLRKAHSLMAREFATYTDSAVAMVGHWLRDLAPTPPNVYVGTTVTTQDEADERISDLLSIPARVRVLRVSPREPLDLALAHPSQQHDERSALDGIGWVDPLGRGCERHHQDHCEARMSDLKPCPFCVGASAQALVNFDGYHFVGCECGAEGPAVLSNDDARALWNTRPGEEALRKERDEARGELVKALREGLSESQRLKAERDEARAEVERLREWCVSPCSEAACDYDAMPGPCSEAPGRTCSECCPMHRCGGGS